MTPEQQINQALKKSEVAILSGDQARVVIPTASTPAPSKAVRSRGVDTQEPSIPAGATKMFEQGWGGMWTFDNPDNNYYLPAGETLKLDYVNGIGDKDINLYVAGDLTISRFDQTPKSMHLYILKGGKFSGYDTTSGSAPGCAYVPANWTVDVWGEWSFGDRFRLDVRGGNVTYHKGAKDVVYGNGSDATETWNNSFSISSGTFYSEVPVEVDGNAHFTGGVATFAEGIVVDMNVTTKRSDNGQTPVVNIYKCSKVLQQWTGEANSAGIYNVYDYLYIGSLHDNGADVYLNLYDALVDIDNVFPSTLPWGYNINNLVDKDGHGFRYVGKPGKYQSVVRYLNNDLYIDKGNNYEVVAGGDGTPTQFVSEISFTGNVTLLSEKVRIQYPKIQGKDDVTEIITFKDGSVAYNDASTYLPTNAEGCRPKIGNEPVITVDPPLHKYSATSLDFGKNGELYLSWHSNIGADGEPGHAHGTNMYITNLDGSSVSVDNLQDWGGIIDVMDVTNPAATQLTQTLIQGEHKYNHVVYNDGMLYLPSTSNKVGAALHEIALSADGTINEATFDAKNVRVNLTGTSANCAIVNNNNIITISGNNNGGINKFATTDFTNQESKAIVTSDPFQGKYIYNDGTNIITLNNTTDGTVTIYTQQMGKVSSFNVGSIRPTDGKNVCIADGQYIYICRGANGFDIYNYSGTRVGGTKKSANGVDVDNKNIYLATGSGLVVLSKTETYVDDFDGKTYNKTIARYTYTGTGNPRYDETIAKSANAGAAKQSSNFVKVKDGKAYVAYGMYGLQVYDISDLLK